MRAQQGTNEWSVLSSESMCFAIVYNLAKQHDDDDSIQYVVKHELLLSLAQLPSGQRTLRVYIAMTRVMCSVVYRNSDVTLQHAPASMFSVDAITYEL